MTCKSLFRALGAASLMLATAGMAQAGDSKTIADWKEECGKIVSYKMAYPSTTMRRSLPDSFNVVEVEMARDGTVLSAELTGLSESPIIDRASERFAKSLKSLPALPASYDGETASVRIHLLYAETERGLENLARAVVRTRQLADDQEEGERMTAMIDLMVAGGR